jgi:hypothetical protein
LHFARKRKMSWSILILTLGSKHLDFKRPRTASANISVALVIRSLLGFGVHALKFLQNSK